MGTKINIMGLDVDIISIDSLIENVSEYLTNDYMNTIFLASTKMLMMASEDKEYKEIIESADLLLPGEETLLSMHHVDTLETVGMIVNFKFLISLFKDIFKEPKTVFILGEDEAVTQELGNSLMKRYANVTVGDSYYGSLEDNSELIINKVNAIAPDLLLLAVDSPLQENFIMEHNTKLNTKLTLCIGSVIGPLLKTYKDVPAIFRRLGLENWYRERTVKNPYKKNHQKRIFQKKVEHYKNKKGDSIDGDRKQ